MAAASPPAVSSSCSTPLTQWHPWPERQSGLKKEGAALQERLAVGNPLVKARAPTLTSAARAQLQRVSH